MTESAICAGAADRTQNDLVCASLTEGAGRIVPVPNGGSRAPTVASDCDVASLAFQNVCFVPNLAQADDHRAKVVLRAVGHLKCKLSQAADRRTEAGRLP